MRERRRCDGDTGAEPLQVLQRRTGAAGCDLYRRGRRHLRHGSLRRGKTTLLRILLGLEAADSGTVSGLENCRWAAVFQEDRLLEQLDAAGNLRFILGRDYDSVQAAAMLAELGLGDVNGKPVRAFSGGMRRRLALARALLARATPWPWTSPLPDWTARRGSGLGTVSSTAGDGGPSCW